MAHFCARAGPDAAHVLMTEQMSSEPSLLDALQNIVEDGPVPVEQIQPRFPREQMVNEYEMVRPQLL